MAKRIILRITCLVIMLVFSAVLFSMGIPELFTRMYSDTAGVNEWALRMSNGMTGDMTVGAFLFICGALVLCCFAGSLISLLKGHHHH